MTNIVEFDAMRIRKYLTSAIDGFVSDQPDTEYQLGYLAALCAVYREALNGESDNILVIGTAILERNK